MRERFEKRCIKFTRQYNYIGICLFYDENCANKKKTIGFFRMAFFLNKQNLIQNAVSQIRRERRGTLKRRVERDYLVGVV